MAGGTSTSTCAEATVADIIVKSALIGAVAFIAYSWAVEEGVIGRNLGTRAATYASGRLKNILVR